MLLILLGAAQGGRNVVLNKATLGRIKGSLISGALFLMPFFLAARGGSGARGGGGEAAAAATNTSAG